MELTKIKVRKIVREEIKKREEYKAKHHHISFVLDGERINVKQNKIKCDNGL